MADVFVDLGYRGLSIARNVKLAQIRPSTGYLESQAPMPVGTIVSLSAEDGAAIEAIVAEVREVAQSDRLPGMLVRPKLDGAAAAWWKERATLPELEKPAARTIATVVPKKRDEAAPELIDDGRNTAVMEIPQEAAVLMEASREDTSQQIVDDGKRTTMMDAVDLAALGLASTSGQMAAVTEDDADASSDQPKKKRRKRRPSTQGR
jgi:hypothetical protein